MFSFRKIFLALFLLAVSVGATQNGNAQTIYAVDSGNNTIHRFSSTGADLGTFISSGLNNPATIVVNQAGNFYVANEIDPGTVSEYSPTGTFLATLNVGAGTAFRLAVNSSGNLLVTSPYSNRIRLFSPTNADLGVFASTGLNIPVYLAFDSTAMSTWIIRATEPFASSPRREPTWASSRLRRPIMSTDGFRQQRQSAGRQLCDGQHRGVFAYRSQPGNFASGLNGPEGLAFLPNGNLLVSTDSNVIDQFSPTGAFLGVLASTGLNSPEGLLIVPSAAVPEPVLLPSSQAWAWWEPPSCAVANRPQSRLITSIVFLFLAVCWGELPNPRFSGFRRQQWLIKLAESPDLEAK